jgi:hypothetical protein
MHVRGGSWIGIYTFSKKASGASDEDDLILEMTSYCNRIHLVRTTIYKWFRNRQWFDMMC